MTNPHLFAAGLLCLVATVWHGIGGEISIVRRIPPSAFPASFYGDGDVGRRIVRGAWHFLTAQFLVSAIALLRLAFANDDSAVPTVVAVTFAAYVVVFAIVIVDRPMLFLKVPQWVPLTAISALAWFG